MIGRPDSVPNLWMPRYRCHKEVQALKIAAITVQDGKMMIVPVGEYAAFPVSDEYVKKHNPQAGGYFVLYKDGYQSWSPGSEFEDGYTRI